MTPEWSREEFLIAALARSVQGFRTVGVGTNAPLPAAAALLAQARSGREMTVAILGSPRHIPFTDGGRELFDFAAQGRLDAFFLGGGQIDGDGNVNLVGVGRYPQAELRFPGSFGSPYLAALVPNLILFRDEHSPRVLVPKVDFISAPVRPRQLITGRAVFSFVKGRFALASVHPWESIEAVQRETGFGFALATDFGVTAWPSPQDLDLLRGPIADELADIYPRFISRLRAAIPEHLGEHRA